MAKADSSLSNRRASLSRSLATGLSVDSQITMCVPYWWCTKHAQLIMGTWSIYKKTLPTTDLNKKQKTFIWWNISSPLLFFPFFSICTCSIVTNVLCTFLPFMHQNWWYFVKHRKYIKTPAVDCVYFPSEKLTNFWLQRGRNAPWPIICQGTDTFKQWIRQKSNWSHRNHNFVKLQKHAIFSLWLMSRTRTISNNE